MKKEICNLCGKSFFESDLIQGHGIRTEIESLIIRDNPSWNDNGMICIADYSYYRAKYIQNIIEEETGDVKELEKEVIRSLNDNEVISKNLNIETENILSYGDKIADKVADFGGSWKFIGIFFFILIGWIVLNTVILLNKPFDPFPFILMNLILSCLAAIQAPIIMMSQNRQEAKDRKRAENDFKVNLKSEIEIRTLHEKVDHLLLDQWSKMIKIQELQIDMIEEIKKKIGS